MKSRLLIFLSMFMMSLVMNAQVTSVAIIGSATAGGWDNETPLTLFDDTLQIYVGTVNLTVGEVKFRANSAWDINWGDKEFPLGAGVQGGPNIPIPFAGEYQVAFSALSGEYFFYYESPIGILGSSTYFGWDDDVNLFPDATDTNKFFITLPLKAGEAKFRANDSWDLNWGATDFPSGVGTPGGPNIPIPNVGRYKINFDKSTGAYSFDEIVEFTSIGVIGSATPGGWDNETPLAKDGGNPDLWKGVVAIKEGELKFRANNAWTVSWGNGEFPADTASATGGNIVVPAGAEGDYQVTFNTKTLIYKFLKIGNYASVGIIGDAVNGWDEDVNMTQDPADKSVWRLRTELKNGEAKFRANDSWDVNWGSDGFPSGVATQDGINIPVTAGDYKITFNSTTGEYSFEAVVEFKKISLVGNAGPFGEWPGSDDSKDTYLNKDASNPNLWSHPGVTLTNFDAVTADGGIKFRAEAAWDVNWGSTAFPAGVGTQNGSNILCVAGNYRIDFKSDSGEYAFAPPSSTYNLLSSEIIRISPNPAIDIVNIDIDTDILKGDVLVNVFNTNGQQVMSQKVNNYGKVSLNVTGLNAGNYVVRISNSKNLVAKSLTIIK